MVLDRMGVLSEADGAALERLCDCYAEILECRELIAAGGRTYHSESRAVDEDGKSVVKHLIKAHPAVAMLADADRRFKGYLIEFGLTPSARSKVQAVGDEDKKDPLQEYFA